MKETFRNFIVALNDRKWIYIVAALILVIIVLAVIIAIPLLRSRVDYRVDEGCEIAVRATNGLLGFEAGTMTLEEAQTIVEERGTFCPGGGHFYVIEDPSQEGFFTVVCGLHDPDTARRTELNGNNAMAQIRAALDEAKDNDVSAPDTVTVHLNSEDFTAERRSDEPKIVHGTRSTIGFSGTFICYILDENEDLSFFCYADSNHCVRWRAEFGWVPEGEK